MFYWDVGLIDRENEVNLDSGVEGLRNKDGLGAGRKIGGMGGAH
jgi:hypothetical protein